MSSLWSNAVPVDFIDPEAFLFLGADPSWTPAKEEPQLVPDVVDGLCDLCGSDGTFSEAAAERGQLVFLPGKIRPGSRIVCGRCLKYGRDHMMASNGSKPDQPDDVPKDDAVPVAAEPGFVRRGTITIPEKYARQMKG